MSTTPPEQQQSQRYAGLPGGAIMPVPGNAELAIWLVVEVVLAIVAAVASDFDAHGWAVATTWLTAAYMLSRGVAKASRVLER